MTVTILTRHPLRRPGTVGETLIFPSSRTERSGTATSISGLTSLDAATSRSMTIISAPNQNPSPKRISPSSCAERSGVAGSTSRPTMISQTSRPRVRTLAWIHRFMATTRPHLRALTPPPPLNRRPACPHDVGNVITPTWCRSLRQQSVNPGSGSVSIEAVLVIPAFLLFLALIAAIGRAASVQEDIHAATVAACRIASQQTTSAAAQLAAENAITTNLGRQGITCDQLDVTIDTTALNQLPGQPGNITVSVGCTIPLSDLSVPGLPGQVTLTDQFSSAIDPYTHR